MDASQRRPIPDPELGGRPDGRVTRARMPAQRAGIGRRLRRYFLTGLVAILPVGLVAFVYGLWALWPWITG